LARKFFGSVLGVFETFGGGREKKHGRREKRGDHMGRPRGRRPVSPMSSYPVCLADYMSPSEARKTVQEQAGAVQPTTWPSLARLGSSAGCDVGLAARTAARPGQIDPDRRRATVLIMLLIEDECRYCSLFVVFGVASGPTSPPEGWLKPNGSRTRVGQRQLAPCLNRAAAVKTKQAA